MNLDVVSSKALESVIEVGDYVARSQSNIGQLRMKGVKNPQTDIDVKAEDMMRENLSKILPEAGFIVEEGVSKVQNEMNWAIDPIDGTKFFSTLYPVFFTQIALMQGDTAIFSVIYSPVSKQLFHAVKGKGAYLNGAQMHIEYDGPLGECLVGAELGKIAGSDSHKKFINTIGEGVNRLMVVSTLLSPYLLTNTIQAYIRYYNGPNYIYDVEPRWLLHREAGARVAHHTYNGFDLFISAHPKTVQEIEELLAL